MYTSVEVNQDDDDEDVPIPPFILWLTSDKNSGDFFLKVDRKTMFVSSYRDRNNGKVPHALIQALELLFKFQWVGQLKYHPYLTKVYKLIEVMYGLDSVKKTPSLQKLVNAIRGQ